LALVAFSFRARTILTDSAVAWQRAEAESVDWLALAFSSPREVPTGRGDYQLGGTQWL
jgi:hypothetical protein